MKGWHKIDLHQHTMNEITYDGKIPTSEYTHEKFENLLKEEKVELKAVTNHNTLSVVDHIKHALICKKNNINYLPGVEIDYKFGKKHMHAITILNPQNDIVMFSNKLKEYIDTKNSNKFLNKDEFAHLHENMEFIFIPHAMKTQGIYPSAKEQNLEDAEDWVMKMIKNGTFVPVIFENTQNYNKYSIYGKIEEFLSDDYDHPVACYVGSDHRFDNDIKRRDTAIKRVNYYIFAEPTYRGLEISVRNNKTRLAHKSEIIDRDKYLESIEIKDNCNFRKGIKLELSPSLNVIIGGSGAGKTLLLNEIFRCITKKDLKDVKDNSKEKNKNAYYSKIGNGELLEIKSVPENYNEFKVLEIPNIYTEIMKYIGDSEKLGDVFGISNRSYINELINNFILDCCQYSELMRDLKEKKISGDNYLSTIYSCIDFINKNSIEKSSFKLQAKNMDDLDSLKINSIIKKNKDLILIKEDIINYFNEIDKVLDYKFSDKIEFIKTNYIYLLKKLNEKNENLRKLENDKKIIEKIKYLLNEAINESSNKLGTKEKLLKSRESLFFKNQQLLINCVKETLKINKKLDNISLEYPFDNIKNTIETKNANELARFTLSLDKKDLENIAISDSNFIESKNIITKLKKMKIDNVNFLDNQSIKKFIDELLEMNLEVRNVIKKELPLTLELNVNGEWKSATEINQGTIAKISMGHYFNNIIKNEQPDIIFIDQPENDVDKEFLTDTLAKFLLDTKVSSQIFITSHDAILTVNSDANMIIQADIDENNKISYMSYPLEYTDVNELGTDNVARILDGGKHNIAKRYQIYGGVMKYGN